MYSLLGVIQTLLMLTQSRLMPDLGMLWDPKPEISAATPYSTGTGLQVKNTVAYRVYTEAVQQRKKENWHPPVPDKSKRFSKYRQQQAIRREQNPAVNKLYLVFCQLKTEG